MSKETSNKINEYLKWKDSEWALDNIYCDMLDKAIDLTEDEFNTLVLQLI